MSCCNNFAINSKNKTGKLSITDWFLVAFYDTKRCGWNRHMRQLLSSHGLLIVISFSVMLFAVATHPDMKTVIVIELERLLYRPHVAAKAQ